MFGLGNLFGTNLAKSPYGPVTVNGVPLRCVVCRHDEFHGHRVQLHTPAATMFNLEMFNRVADCAICAGCGYVHFFVALAQAPDSNEGN